MRFRRRLSLQAKVMAVVVAVLVALPAITLSIVNDQLRRQLQADAELALSTAHASFGRLLDVRTNELEARIRACTDDPRFQQVARLADAPTMKDHLRREVLDKLRDDTEIALFVGRTGELQGARRDGTPVTAELFATAADEFIHAALDGEQRTGAVACNGSAYQVVALPVVLPEGSAGALVCGIRITEATLQSVRPPASEILVIGGTAVLASTLKDSLQTAVPAGQLAASASPAGEAMVSIAGQRYKPVTGVLKRSTLRYMLLTATEQRLAAYEHARFVLLALSGGGLLTSAGVVWFFVRRITRPLVELRNNAEAVGAGDFSRKIERFSNDECGDLAEAFNRMTANLQSSRAELERAMQQVRTTQEQLIQSEKLSAVGQFVAGVAHELNNPLTAVVGFSELVQTMQSDAKINAHLDRIAKSAHRCHKIVHSLLSFARQHPPERKRVDLHEVIEDVLEIMCYDLRTSNVTIQRQFAPGLAPVMADAHQLQQVFINIIGNARQAIEPFQREGRIIVRTRQAGLRLQVEFEDNGPGIRQEHLARIFDPFFTTKPVGKGTGLGLSLCYGLVQEHGGNIAVRSEVGHGATFCIDLPVAEGEPAPTAILAVSPPTSVSPGARTSSGRSVLVIDDESWILDLAAELLRTDGHAVETAAGGQQALVLLQRKKYDVIVSDWKMPGLNGIRLYEHLRATDPQAAERVMFMTGDVVSDTFQDFLRQHALTCLAKPFATGEFRAAVTRMCSAPAGVALAVAAG